MAGWWRWALAATVVLALAGGALWRLAQPAGARWEVVRLDGSPSVATKPIGGKGQVGAGEWIETDARSRAVVKVGEIGSVEVAPNTFVGVVAARPGEHRLALVRGEIRAKITAPPRLFFSVRRRSAESLVTSLPICSRLERTISSASATRAAPGMSW